MELAIDPTEAHEKDQWPRNHTDGHGITIHYGPGDDVAILYNPMARNLQKDRKINYIIPCISVCFRGHYFRRVHPLHR